MKTAFLLQAVYNSPWALIALLALIALFAAVSVIQSYRRRRELSNTRQGSYNSRNAPPTIYPGPSFKKAARDLGFTKEQIAFLDSYGQRFDVRNPEHILKNAEELDTFLMKIFQHIEQNPDKENFGDQKTTMLFQIREYLDRMKRAETPLTSTHALSRGQAFTFVTAEGEHFSSKVVSPESTGIACAIPLDHYGQEIRFQRGAKLTCYLYVGNESGYSFSAKVLGYMHGTGQNYLVLKHTDQIERLPIRQHRRREATIPCAYSPVTVLTERVNGKNQRRILVSDQSSKALISDISAGGMSIKTARHLPESSYIKVDFDLPKGRLSAIGKIVKANALPSGGIISHLQYVKITRREINKILSYVYRYERL
jgi:c-di-GMP-binding flagellar brake protein YcgR